MTEETNIKLTSRPLRLVYLARSRDDIANAVRLYTHTWGGVGNFIFPLPTSDDEVIALRQVLRQTDPDYVLMPLTEVLPQLAEVLDSLPCLVRPVTPEEIEDHVQAVNWLHMQGAALSHIGSVIQRQAQRAPQDNQIRVSVPDDPFGFEVMLHGGDPTEHYKELLVDKLAARVLSSPATFSALLKTLLVLSNRSNPLRVSAMGARWQYSWLDVAYDTDPSTLFLFLGDGNGIEAPTAFWNNRKLVFGNKVFLPKDLFLANLHEAITLIGEAIPSIRALYVRTPLDRPAAEDLKGLLRDAFAASGRDVSVMVVYKRFGFDTAPGYLSGGRAEQFSQFVMVDRSVRLRVNAPPGHDNTGFLFGYDAEVKFVSDRELIMPPTRKSSELLSNELERIQNAERNTLGLGRRWLRTVVARCVNRGVAGIAQSGQECRLFIHSDETIIEHHIRATGLRIKPNRHTRYAKGFIKRLGGTDEAMRLTSEGGIEILLALRSDRAQQCGFPLEQIVSYLTSQVANSPSRENVELYLRQLLSAGYVRRGYALTCEICDLRDWYSLESIRESVECNGCAEPIALPYKLHFFYRANELAARFVESGGQAVLMVAHLLRCIDYSGYIQFGGDVLRETEATPFVEVDLLWLTDEVFAIAECKAYRTVGEDQLTEFETSLRSKVSVAPQLGAKVVILGVVASDVDARLFEAVTAIAEQAKGDGIGVHLALNGQLYLWGNEKHEDVRKIDVAQLLPPKPPLTEPRGVGETPDHWGFGGIEEPLSHELLARWEKEFHGQSS